MNQVIIRSATPNDLESVIALCAAHAEYEQAQYVHEGKYEGLQKDIFSNPPKLYCLVAEADGALMGYATYMKQYATWEAKEYVYMDCLFVTESARGSGIGEHLVNEIKTAAALMGCALIQWQTPTFNTRAMKFYKRIGASSLSKERFFLNVPSDE